jgi:hypothetical protein
MVEETHVTGVTAMTDLVQFAVRPFARLWGHAALLNLDDGPRPTGDPRSHASGTDSERVLLFGSGPAVGWGVASHDLALPGSLARALSNLTGRGADVDALAGSEFTAKDSIHRLRSVDLTRYDAIVVTLGFSESMRLSSLAGWRRDLDALLAYLAAVASPRTELFVLGLQITTRIHRYDRVIAPLVARHRAALNRASAQACAHRDHAMFVRSGRTPRRDRDRSRSAANYRDQGTMLALQIAPVLDKEFRRQSATGRRLRSATRDEAACRRAILTLRIIDTPAEQRFDRIAEYARRAFQTPTAAIILFDQQRYWTKSSIGAPRSEGLREHSIAFTVLDDEDSLVVADTHLETRFAAMAHVTGWPSIRFYAGHRIEAPGGEPIGVLCVYDSTPHDVTGFNLALLRDLALLVQKEICVDPTSIAIE